MSTYTGYFMSRRSEQWTVQVITDGGSESNSLALAASPLTIEMDDNDDMLSPVRLTTGYLRVIGYNRSLYPSRGSQIRITVAEGHTSGTDWRGYIQPQAYDIDVVTHPSDVYEIPVECPLSALAHIDLPVAYFGDFPSFGTILYYIMQTQSSSWSTVYMPSTIEGQNVLSCCIDRRLLVETDSNGNEQPKYNCLEFIEEFCKFFGYCCRYDGNGGMLFMRMFKQQTSYAYIGMYNLPNAYSSSYWYTGNYSSITGSKENYASTNQKFQEIPGYRKVKVNADVAKATTTLFEMPNNWLCDYLYDCNTVRGSTVVGDYSCREAVAARSYEYSFEHDGWNWYFSMPTMKDNYTIKNGSRVILLSYTSGKQPSSEWKPAIEVAGGSSSSTIFRLTSQRGYCLDSGLLVISATTYTKHNHVKYSGNGNLQIRVGYGGYYYNVLNKTWSSSNGATPIVLCAGNTAAEDDKADTTGQIDSTLSYVDSRYNYKGGLAIPINLDDWNMQASRGQIELEICSVALNNSGDYGNTDEICIEDLKIEFLPDGMKNVAFEQKDEAYIYNTGSNFRQDKEISVIFASDKYKIPGENSLYNNYSQLVSTLPFYYGETEYQHPEYFVAKHAGIFGSRTHKILDIEVDAYDTGWCHPLTVITGFEPSGRPWYVVSVDKDFANCTQRIRAIEL